MKMTSCCFFFFIPGDSLLAFIGEAISEYRVWSEGLLYQVLLLVDLELEHNAVTQTRQSALFCR